jgi:hypothetical protein
MGYRVRPRQKIFGVGWVVASPVDRIPGEGANGV